MDLSVVCGPPLSAEPGLGALTLPGFLREVPAAYAGREALVLGATRWTYDGLWEHAVEVARALRGCGVGRDGRIGVLMTNRPEWVAAVRSRAADRRGRPATVGQVPVPAPPGHDRRGRARHRDLGRLPGPRAGRAARTGQGDGRGG